jgi:hypothetical protein
MDDMRYGPSRAAMVDAWALAWIVARFVSAPLERLLLHACAARAHAPAAALQKASA